MQVDSLRPTQIQQKVRKSQVEEQVTADIVADKIKPRQAACQPVPDWASVVDQDQVALCNGCQPAAGLHLHGEIAQVGAVAPQAGLQQGFEAHPGLQRGKLLPNG